MRKWLWGFLLVGLSLSVPGGVQADVTDAEILDYGILSARVTKTTKDQTLVQGGHHSIEGGKLLKRTTEIPAEKGLKFGIKYLVKGYPIGTPVKIDFIVLYPEKGLTNPHTGKTDHQGIVSLAKKIGRVTATGYLFNTEWEMVPGKWTFQVWHAGRKLVEKTFTVYLP